MTARRLILPATILILALSCSSAPGGDSSTTDIIPTSGGDLTLSFIGHGTLMFEWDGKVVHIDPVGREGDYSRLPDADLILVTHAHGDHLDPDAIAQIRKEGTVILCPASCAGRLEGATVIANGGTWEGLGIGVEAVPAYNLVHVRDGGQPYHPKGDGNGYVLTFGDVRVYVAGDTENTPEMKALKDIDVAFLPMNLPYTMTPEMVADAARAFRPRILYPYHYGETDPQTLRDLLAGEPGIEIRVRDLQ